MRGFLWVARIGNAKPLFALGHIVTIDPILP
ncbi:MAG: hypothetical protein ACI91G_000228 [Gammaproteobacteria bacterium]|jgi:hypothetical protein